MQHGQVVLLGKLAADLAPLAQEAAFGKEEDPGPPAGRVHPGQVIRQIRQRLLPTVFALFFFGLKDLKINLRSEAHV